MNIVAATDLSVRSHRALRRAGHLARAAGAELTILHVVEDDQPKDLMEIESREAKRILDEQISAMAELQGLVCHPVVIAGDAFDGILRAAKMASAALIVMGSHRKQLLRDIFIGTTIERVVRTGPFPVLMVNDEVVDSYRNVMAAVDLSAFSAQAITTAVEIGILPEARLTLVHGFDPWAKGRMSLANIPQSQIDAYVSEEKSRAAADLESFLAAEGFREKSWLRMVEEGGPFEVVARAVKAVRPELLILGTHGRSGIGKFLLGSVTEEALRSLDVDILAVPPKEAS